VARITLEHVEKSYPNGVRAVEDFSLAVDEGQLLTLVGPSGCGKTTILRLIAGLESPGGGTIRLGDRVVNGVPPQDRDVAMVFQNLALYPHLTARENLAFSLRRRGVPKKAIVERVREAASALGIEHLLDSRPRELSGGEAQRVALGRAIVRRPACFLLDEPLSSLDAPLRAELRGELRRLHRRLKTTMIYVTHDQEEAMTLGGQVAVVHRGRLQQVGPPLSVYHRPRNGFVAGFLGSPPMNFLSGTLVQEEGVAEKERLVWRDGEHRVPVPVAMTDRLAASIGPKVVLGIRPEALRATPWSEENAAFSATVEAVEPRGDRVDVHLSAGGPRPLVARLDAAAPIAPGESLTLYLDPARLDFFAADADSPGGVGENLCG
jgi:multiple sugar transport system ATP-binding protein